MLECHNNSLKVYLYHTFTYFPSEMQVMTCFLMLASFCSIITLNPDILLHDTLDFQLLCWSKILFVKWYGDGL